MNKAVMAELARRELARRNYEQYLSLVQGPQWVRTGLSQYLSRKIQTFLEEDLERIGEELQKLEEKAM